MKAKDYRARARQSLTGKWGLAVGTTLVASLLGGAQMPQISISLPTGDTDVSLGDSAYFNSSVDESVNMSPEAFESAFDTLWTYTASYFFVALVFMFVAIILGGATKTGLCRFNKNLYYGSEPKFKDIFTHYNIVGKTLWASVLIFVFVFCWYIGIAGTGMVVLTIALPAFESLPTEVVAIAFIVCATLLMLPAISASLSYTMTFYILDENPEMKAREAITASKILMDGHKWQYFCLLLSFYGWLILSALTLGIGILFYNPYWLASEYAFYNQIAHGGETPEEYSGEPQVTGEIVDVPVEEAPVVEA